MNKPFPLFKWNESKHLWSQAWGSYKIIYVFMHQTRIGSWGSAPDHDEGACSTPPYLLAGQQGATPPAPSPGGSFSILYKSCIWQCVPYHTYIYMYYPGYAIAWLSPLITCFAPPPTHNLATGLNPSSILPFRMNINNFLGPPILRLKLSYIAVRNSVSVCFLLFCFLF